MTVTRRSFDASPGEAAAAAFIPAEGFAAVSAARMTPTAALTELLAGNERFATGGMQHVEYGWRRESVASAQQPFAVVLSCSDSRVPPEIVFDQGLGDIFVVRVAGNYAAPDGVGSIEYAVSHFASSAIVVLGHSGCGAVHATVDALRGPGPSAPGNIADIVRAITPSVKAVLHKPGDVYANATIQNVRDNVAKLKASGAMIGPAEKSGKVQIVGGIYDLKTGKVSLI
ncbi:MAG: carbonic anhydrase [Vulcanimicrobiaceae bacterium]